MFVATCDTDCRKMGSPGCSSGSELEGASSIPSAVCAVGKLWIDDDLDNADVAWKYVVGLLGGSASVFMLMKKDVISIVLGPRTGAKRKSGWSY